MSQIQYPKYVQPANYQITHFEKIDKITKQEKYYADGSDKGNGKTIPPLYLCQNRNLRLFVVCPLSVVDSWIKHAKIYGIPVECIVTYDSLRSTKGRQPKHGYLNRVDTLHAGGGSSVEFKATEKLVVAIKNGLKVIFDECHKLKNRSAQFKACKEICRAVYEIEAELESKAEVNTKCESTCGFLSATFFDKKEHSKQVLELFGIITANFMYRTNNITGLVEYAKFGLGEVIQKASSYDSKTTAEIVSKFNLNTGSINGMETTTEKLCYELLTKVIFKYVGSVMDNTKDRDLKKSVLLKDVKSSKLPLDVLNIVMNYLIYEDKKNGYFKVSKDVEKQIQDKVEQYAKAIGFNHNDDNVDLRKLGSAIQITEQIETLKLEIFEREAIKELEANPKCKGVIFLNFIDNIEELAERLRKYNPIIFYGKTKNRGAWIDKFMNDSNSRLFIANTLISQGFEIDDQKGDEERFVLISTSHRVIEMDQAMGRVFRKNTKSSVKIRIVYANIKLGKHQLKEARIINAIVNKTGVLKSLPGGDKRKYPGDFEDEYEM